MKTEQLNVRIPAPLAKRLRVRAAKANCKISQLVAHILAVWLSKKEIGE